MKVAHDDAVQRPRDAARALNLQTAAGAFVASLGSAPLRYRPVLAHLAYATNFGPYREAPHMRREALALEGIEMFVTEARSSVLDHGLALPEPLPPFRVIASRNLLYAMSTLLASDAL